MTRTALQQSIWGPADTQRRNATARRNLLASIAAPVLDLPNLRVDASCLPLFRRSAGGLTQVVRLHVSATHDSDTLRFTVRDQSGAVADEAEAPVTAGERSLDLQVPEVTRKSTFLLELAGVAAATKAPLTVTPQRKWTVFLIHHSHLDNGYTDLQGAVARTHHAYLDGLAELADATDDWPDDARFRWNIEASWPLVRWLETRSKRAVDRLVARIHEGRVEVTALPFTLHTEACSTDELYRLLRTTETLRSRYGLPITTAMQTDVPGATVGLVDALAGSDIRYLSVAHNWAGRSVPFLVGGQDLERPFYWTAPSGNRVLVWFTDSPNGLAYMEGTVIGLADDYDTALTLLPAYLRSLATTGYPLVDTVLSWQKLTAGVPLTKRPYDHDILHLRVQGTLADNAPPTLAPATIARRWNDTWAYPRLRMATGKEFFSEAEHRLAGRIPTHRGDWTDWWADGIGSGARALGLNRRAQSTLPTAETLHTVADLRSGVPEDVTRELDGAQEKLALFDEHTWGASNPWEDAEEHRDSGSLQWTRKSEYAHQAFDEAQDLLDAGALRLGETFAPSPGALASVLVFNASTGVRTDVARVFLPAGRTPLDAPLSLVDARTGAVVPHREEAPPNGAHRPVGRYLEFVARDVPGVGYARVDVVAGDGPQPEVTIDGATAVENERYRLSYDLDAACVSSIVDKVARRELVDQGAVTGFNQYLYDRYTSAPYVNHLSSRTTADPSLLGSRSVGQKASIVSATRDAVGEKLVVDLWGEGTRGIRTSIRLPREVARVDIANRVQKEPQGGKESGFFCFPFDIPAEPVAYEVSGGVVSPGGPFVPGAARHMRAIRHWVALEHDDLAVAWATLEAPLVQFGNLHLPYAPFPPSLRLARPEPATIYSWVLNNIWDTNFPAHQQGEMTFRYAVASARGTASRELSTGTADGLTVPFIAVLASGEASEHDVRAEGAVCVVDHPGLRVAAIGRSRSGHDLAIRLLSTHPQEVRAPIRLPAWRVRAAWTGTYLERRLVPAAVSDDCVEVVVPAESGAALVLDLG